MQEHITVEPREFLVFPRPLKGGSRQTIRIVNGSDVHYAFKFKTTSPKQYSVKPSNGFVMPGQEKTVEVTFQPLTDEPAADAVSKDKFLVMLVPCPSHTESMSPVQFIEESPRQDALEYKIRVVYGGVEEKRSVSFAENTPRAVDKPPRTEPAATVPGAVEARANVVEDKVQALKDRIVQLQEQVALLEERLASQEAEASQAGYSLAVLLAAALLAFLLGLLF